MTARKSNLIISLTALAAVLLFAGVLFDYYFEFNDDVLMKDILSGAYTGTPEALNIQMLSPLSSILSLMYRISSQVSWYGIFLLVCQYLSVALIMYRAFSLTDSTAGRIIMGAVAFLFCTGLILPHLVLVQYTITAGLMAAAAGFLIYTTPKGLDNRSFYLKMILPVILIVSGFWLRSEMMLLMMPFLAFCTASLIHREGVRPFKRYIMITLVTGILIVLSLAVDGLSYSSPQWKSFRSEFDSRTLLYDYQYVPEYDEARTFYESEGISEAQVELLKTYDYGIDKRIDGPLMNRVAMFAKASRSESMASRLAGSLIEYLYRCSHLKGGVYSVLVLFLYVMTVVAITHNVGLHESLHNKINNTGTILNTDMTGLGAQTVRNTVFILILRVCGLFAARSICWLYIIYGRRLPDRITHPLYIMEIVILLAMILTEYAGTLRGRRYLKMVTAIILIVGGIVLVPLNVKSLNTHIASQEKINAYADAIDEYCTSHPDCFYWEDVYSTIIEGETFNEKMFGAGRAGVIKNYDLIGGWCMNSPLLQKKTARFGIDDIAGDLISSDSTYIIIADIYDTDMIRNYYSDTGISADLERTDSIAGTFGVYRVKSVK